jgi:hypothetical protein
MENEVFQYMVEFTLPTIMTERFTGRIPEQRALVNKYFSEGKLVTYGVSLENSRAWAAFNAETEAEVLALIRALPLTQFCQYKIHALTFYNVLTAKVPLFSVN